MRLRLAACACGLVVASSASAAPGAPLLDVDAAVARALAHNRLLVQATEHAGTERLDVDAARHAFALRWRPTVGYTARSGETFTSYGLAADRRLMTGTELSAAVTRSEGRLATGAPFSIDRLSLELRQPLFRQWGVAMATEPVRAATADWRRAQSAAELRRADVALAVVRQYEDIRRLRGQVTLTRNAVRRTGAHYQVTRRREAAGRQRRLDTLRAELQLGRTHARLERELEQLAVAERLFAELLGAPVDARFSFTTGPPVAFDIIDVDDAIQTALENRVDYAQAWRDYDEALHLAALTGRERLPDLSMYVRFQHFPDALNAAEVASFGADGVSVGLIGGFNPNAGRARIAVQRAERIVAAARQSVEIVEQRIRREVSDAVAAYQRAFADAELAELQLGVAERQMALARRLFSVRRSDGFAVGEAEDALAQAEARALSARAEAGVQTHALAYALGTLVPAPQDLKRVPTP